MNFAIKPLKRCRECSFIFGRLLAKSSFPLLQYCHLRVATPVSAFLHLV
jgi:hypothetical protein